MELLLFLKDCIYLFLKRWKGREEERKTNTHVRERDVDKMPPVRTPTGEQTCDLLVCGVMPNPLSHTGQGRSYF